MKRNTSKKELFQSSFFLELNKGIKLYLCFRDIKDDVCATVESRCGLLVIKSYCVCMGTKRKEDLGELLSSGLDTSFNNCIIDSSLLDSLSLKSELATVISRRNLNKL